LNCIAPAATEVEVTRNESDTGENTNVALQFVFNVVVYVIVGLEIFVALKDTVCPNT